MQIFPIGNGSWYSLHPLFLYIKYLRSCLPKQRISVYSDKMPWSCVIPMFILCPIHFKIINLKYITWLHVWLTVPFKEAVSNHSFKRARSASSSSSFAAPSSSQHLKELRKIAYKRLHMNHNVRQTTLATMTSQDFWTCGETFFLEGW